LRQRRRAPPGREPARRLGRGVPGPTGARGAGPAPGGRVDRRRRLGRVRGVGDGGRGPRRARCGRAVPPAPRDDRLDHAELARPPLPVGPLALPGQPPGPRTCGRGVRRRRRRVRGGRADRSALARRRGELTVRVNARPTLDKWAHLRAVGIQHGFGDDWLRIGGLKGFVDGIMGNSSARFYEPYLHTGERGAWRDSTNTSATSGPGSGMMPPGNMKRLIQGADSSGLWPHVHAIGDEAIDTLIDIIEQVFRENGERDRRLRIIHTQVLRDPEVAERMARLGLIAEVQPYHAIDDMRWMEERIGERARWAYAFRTLRDAGVMLSFGSDWPGTNASWYTANPLAGVYAAVTRQTLDGEPADGWFPEERIDVETALRAYTVNNAWAAGEEDLKGTLEPGKLADLVVLDRDPFAVPPEEIKDIRVLLTVVGGRPVYEVGRVAAGP